MKEHNFAVREAFFYTLLVGFILLAPLSLYTLYMKNVFEVRKELEMKKDANVIIQAMENHDEMNEPFFDYPRFRSFESGLYDRHFKAVFTLIEESIPTFSPGFYIEGSRAYLVLHLPKERYFGANYLVLSSELSYVQIYQKSTFILLLIVILVFLLSLFFLKRFAAPFRQANAHLDNFIKDSMHEINTPLSIINTNIDLYNMHNTANKYFTRIKAAAKTLGNIYNDMDYLIKNENIDLSCDKIDLSAFVSERVAYFEEVAAQKEIRIQTRIDGGIQICFNISQLQRIVDNNLSNAIKYSHEHGIIEILLYENQKGEVVMSFRDFGIGIEDTGRIFERYYREERDKGGFGIGLNIVKNIIDSVGIRLEVESRYSKGSHFIYTLPVSMRILDQCGSVTRS